MADYVSGRDFGDESDATQNPIPIREIARAASALRLYPFEGETAAEDAKTDGDAIDRWLQSVGYERPD